jgi:cytochrome c
LALKTAIQQTVGKSQLLGTPSVEDGEKVFRDCKPCHTLAEGKNRVGPNLYHIVGRKAGTVEGFAYSNAMKHAGIIWNEKNLKEFLAKPMWFIAGNKMAFAGIKQENELNNLIAYLKEVASAP